MKARAVLAVIAAAIGFGLILSSAFCPNWLWWGWGMLVLSLLLARKTKNHGR